jgi:hypothetical protein
MRVENEYARCGTLAYLAYLAYLVAYDVHRGQVMGRDEPATGIKPFTALVDQVMNAEPYASARRVFRVVDDGASHRDWAAARPDERRLAERGHGAPAGARLPAQPDRGTTFRSSSASCWSLMTSLICPSSQRRSAASSAGTAAQPSSPGSAAP